MGSVRKELEEMQEIVAYDLDVTRTKACWFPFKKAYERNMMQSEFEGNPKVYVLEGKDDPFSKSFEVSLGHNTNRGSLPPESTHLDLHSNHGTRDLPLTRSELYDDAETTSTVTEEDDLVSDRHSIHGLAEIPHQCMTSQFWVEDLLDARSLSCTDEFVSAGRSVTRMGRSFSTFNSHTTTRDGAGSKNEHADDFSLSISRSDIPMTPARIEIEYDFSRRSLSSDPEIHPRSIKRVMCGVSKRKDKTLDNGANHTMISSVSNSSYSTAPKKGPSHSQSSGSAKSQVPNFQSNAFNSDMTEMTNEKTSGSGGMASQQRAIEVDLTSVRLPKHRILCGATARRRHKELPTEIHYDPSDEEKKVDESILNDPTPSEQEPLHPPVRVDPSGTLCMTNPQFDAPWMSNMTNKLRSKTCSVTPLNWEDSRIASVDDSAEQQFFVEVEATAMQLKTIKDLDEIKKQEAVTKAKAPRAVAHARGCSLVDDDSAFMERARLVDVLKRLAPKRSSSVKNESVAKTRLKEGKVSAAKPVIASSFTPPRSMRNDRTSAPPPSRNMNEQPIVNNEHNLPKQLSVEVVGRPPSFQHVNSIVSQGQHRVPRYHEGKENSEGHWSHHNMSESAFRDANDDPIEQTLAQTRSSTGSADRRWSKGVTGTPAGSPWSAWLPEANRSYDSRRTTSTSGSGHLRTHDYVTVTEYPTEPARGLQNPWSEWPPEASRSYDSRRTTSTSGSGHTRPRDRVTVTEYPTEPTKSLQTHEVDSVKSTDEDEVGSFKHDFELARFPSLSSSAWQNADRKLVEILRQPNTFKAEQDSQFRHDRDETLNAQIESNHDSMKRKSSNRPSSREDWVQVNSDEENELLRRGFLKAVPFAVEYRNAPDQESFDSIDHRGMRRNATRSNAAVEKPIKTANKGPAKIWIDDDESELNTEAFQKLSMDSDDDSIFNGLVDRSPSDLAIDPGKSEGQPRVIQPRNGSGEIDYDSSSSENSIEESRNAPRRAIYPTQSKGQLTRVSTGLSALSRDELTAYTGAQSIIDEPFNCMDSWLD